MNLFLVPASQENVDKTIIGAVSFSAADKFLTTTQADALRKAVRNRQGFHCWAMTESLRSTFNSMQVGDVILMTIKGTGAFNYQARVVHKLESEKLGESLWSYQPARPWKLIYILEDITSINVNKSRLVDSLGYNPDYFVAGAIRVSDERLYRVLARYGSISQLIKYLDENE
jgi:uncharacterized Fe-S cluster-containing MiaB family protein